MQKTLNEIGAAGAGPVCRFAPSPTGDLHIGGARTALFNLLFARRHGGRLLLRIDDTDRARSTEAAVAAIFDGLSWLGIAGDAAPVFQHTRLARHAEVARQLLEAGAAYRCWCGPEELEAMRRRAAAAHRPPRYDGTWRDRDSAEAPAGVEPVIRLKAPLDGETVIDDQVAGPVRFANRDLDDFVLLRSDGTPTYMLSTVVDDHDMGVTHVIRGNDHLTNAARQAQIYDALGWARPVHAHVPLIHGADGQKLSKRHGAVAVDHYRALGFLPEAMADYLSGLGWSRGGARFLAMEEAAARFALDEIAAGPARFDLDALTEVNFHWMKQAADARLADLAAPHLADLLGRPLDGGERDRLLRAMPGLKERAKTLVHLAETAAFYFVARPLPIEPAAAALLEGEGRDRLAALRPALDGTAWERPALEAAVKAAVAEQGVKFPAVAQPLRAALTGRTNSPGVADVMAVLGREESLGRIDDALRAVKS